LPAGRDTIVQRVTVSPWRVQSTIRISGRYGIPGADFNGSTTGLSADGRTLVLEQVPPSGGVRKTRLLVLDSQGRLAVRKAIVLPGWSTVDAISPHGRWMYLIHYPSTADVSRYEVLAYDLPRGRLVSKPIVDPRDRDEAMTGFAVSRVTSPDGRWAYTLYGRPKGGPFVHALDTAGVRAICVDLPALAGTDFGAAHLQLGARATSLKVTIEGLVRAVINTRTFAVSPGTPPPAPARGASPDQRDNGGGGGVPWELVVLPIAALAAFGVAVWRRAKPRLT
jgi:hypothetical protein